jgi:phage-related protein
MQRVITSYGKYFMEFYSSLDKGVQEKIDYAFEMIKIADKIPKKFFDHLTGTDGIYEIRIEYESNIYRILCFFDKGNLVVLINSFQKKTQKTPSNEIKMAEKLKKQYFIDKRIYNENKNSNTKKTKK